MDANTWTEWSRTQQGSFSSHPGEQEHPVEKTAFLYHDRLFVICPAVSLTHSSLDPSVLHFGKAFNTHTQTSTMACCWTFSTWSYLSLGGWTCSTMPFMVKHYKHYKTTEGSIRVASIPFSSGFGNGVMDPKRGPWGGQPQVPGAVI